MTKTSLHVCGDTRDILCVCSLCKLRFQLNSFMSEPVISAAAGLGQKLGDELACADIAFGKPGR